MRFRIAVNTKLWLFVQNCFVVIGMSASGAVTGALVVITFVQVLFVPEKTTSEWDNVGAVYALVFFIPASLSLGGIAGFVAGMSWVRQHKSCRWGTATWAGIVLGLFLGLAWGSTLFRSQYFVNKIATVLVSASSATLTGSVASYVVAVRNNSKNRS
ncbi:MAG: hypothetical protein MK102_09865 [Fuerstiella sp.]|nr:hypothetical protein [Fuerstiella sp.]